MSFSIATFNCNSLRARMHIVTRWLKEREVDVLCLQETKIQDDAFPEEEFRRLGYESVYKGQKSYNGVAVLSRHSIDDAQFGFNDGEDLYDDVTRLARCRIKGLLIVNTYVPQGKSVIHDDFQRKLRWFERLRELFARRYRPDQKIIWCGDLNVAPEPIDVHDPDLYANHVCFHEAVRAALKRVMEWGFVDIFRKFHPEPGQYSFYDYRTPRAVKRNIGWRLDHIMVTRPLEEAAQDAFIDLEPRLWERPSDHTFVVARFDDAHFS